MEKKITGNEPGLQVWKWILKFLVITTTTLFIAMVVAIIYEIIFLIAIMAFTTGGMVMSIAWHYHNKNALITSLNQ